MITARTNYDSMLPVEENYKYNVFISYSSADQPWAEKLFSGLDRKGIELFFDRSRLEAGVPWDTQLLEGLSASQHIVVLWSENAARSDWVRRERGYFDREVDIPIPGQKSSNRRMIFLLLEGDPTAFGNLQMVTDLREAGVYADPPDQVDPNLWQHVVDKVYSAITSDDTSVLMPLVLLTMTREQVENLDLAQDPWFAKMSLGEFLRSIGIESKEELMRFYGSQRTDWRPFGSQPNVWTMLNELRDVINTALGDAGLEGARFRWEPIGENFWSYDFVNFRREVLKLKSSLLSVVIVDPIALYEEGVRERFRLLVAELRNTRVLFMTLLPGQCMEAHRHVRELIRWMASPVFTRLYEPTFRKDGTQAFWSCDLNIGDKLDAMRALLAALEQHLVANPVPKFLQHYVRRGVLS